MPLNTNTAAELTAEQVQTILTQPLEQRSVFLAAGPRIFDSNGSPVRIPKAPGDGSAALSWTGEGEQIAEKNPEFDELTLLPSSLKSVKTITRYSNELARQSVVALESALRDRLVSDVAGKIDTQFLSASDGDPGATGSQTEPRGIFDYAGQTVGSVGALTLDALMDAQSMALGANVDPSGMTLFIRPADYMTIRGIKDTTGRFLVQPDVTSGGTVLPLLGARVAVSSRIPEGYAALVDMTQVAVARDLAPSVKVLSERYADTDEQAIRVVARYDAGAINAAAVVALSGITPPA